MAWPPQPHITSHSNALHRTQFALHCIAPHRIATWCIASILFVCITYRFVQYGNAEHWIASPHLTLYRPRTASLMHHILSHRIASLRLTSYRFALASHRIASHRIVSYSYSMATQRIGSHRIASHRIASPTHSIASHRIASHRISLPMHLTTIVDATTRKTKMSQHFFPGRDRGVIGRFFAAIGGAKFLLFFARSFLTQEELDPL